MSVKKKVIILVVVCVLILTGGIIADLILGKSYFCSHRYWIFKYKYDNKCISLAVQRFCTPKAYS